MPSDRCSPDKLNTENITYGGLVLHAPEVDFDLSFCMYRASYVVWKIAHSARLDDATFIAEESRLIPTYYPIEIGLAVLFGRTRSSHYQDFPIPNLSWKKKISLSMVENWKLGSKNTFNLQLDSTEEVRRLAIVGPMVWNGEHPRVQ